MAQHDEFDEAPRPRRLVAIVGILLVVLLVAAVVLGTVQAIRG
ncbi:MAG: hypothetical protein ACHQDC_09875 [Acidimicrobiales bacterium]|jgi:hypothetical protein